MAVWGSADLIEPCSFLHCHAGIFNNNNNKMANSYPGFMETKDITTYRFILERNSLHINILKHNVLYYRRDI